MNYPKIETLFERDKDTFKVTHVYRRAEFLLINSWMVTEKVDGTNIRILYDPISNLVDIRGRTDKAQIPSFLLTELNTMFPASLFEGVFGAEVLQATLFGEGYGERIQKGGGDYRNGVSFRLFDVLIENEHGAWWLNWGAVESIAKQLVIQTVPVIATASLDEAVDYVTGISYVAKYEKGDEGFTGHECRDREGIVARTDPLLYDNRGNRIMWKLKGSDF